MCGLTFKEEKKRREEGQRREGMEEWGKREEKKEKEKDILNISNLQGMINEGI